MNGTTYLVLAYIAGIGLFWSYAAAIWRTARSLDRAARAAARSIPDNRGDRQ